MEKHRCFKCGVEVIIEDRDEAFRYCSSGMCVNCEQEELGKILEEESFIDRCIKLQEEYAKLWKKGLVGLAETYIHLTPEKFKELFGVGSDVVRKDVGGYIWVSKIYQGIEMMSMFRYSKNVDDIEL